MICEVCKHRELDDDLEKEMRICRGCQYTAAIDPEVKRVAFGVLKAHGKYEKALGANEETPSE